MPNLQKSKQLSAKKVFNKLFSSGCRSPSPAPPGDNAIDIGPQGTEVISATASNTNVTSANAHLSQGTGDVPNNQAPAGVSSYIAPENCGQKIAWHGAQLFLKRFAKVFDHDPVKIAVNLAVVLIDLGNAIADNKDALKELLSQIESRLEVVNSASMQIEVEETEFRTRIESFAQLLNQNILELKTMSKRSTWKVILESDEDKAKNKKILKNIDRETNTFVLIINLKIERNASLLNHSLGLPRLDKWQSTKALYDVDLNDTKLARVSCTKGTRINILNQLYEWAQNSSPESPQVFWLTGHAGSGKSTIAYSVAEHFDNSNNGPNILQASFFCSRQFEDTRRRAQIIPTLVYQLAHNSKSFAESLLKLDKLDSVHKLKRQMKDLLVDPWHSASKKSQNLPPYLIVIDALDEIQNHEGSAFLKELLEAVKNNSLHGLKFLVTSRLDQKIADLCKSFSSEAICKLYDIAADEVNTDILTYLKSELLDLQDSPDLTKLVQQANALSTWPENFSKSAIFEKWKKHFASVPIIKGIKRLTRPLFKIKHRFSIQCIAFSSDGKHIVCGSSNYSVYIWNPFTGAELQQLTGHNDGVTSIAFSPNGKHIVSGSWDKSVHIWDSSTGAGLQQLTGHSDGVNSVAFSPDGKYIVSGSWDKSVCIWDSFTGAELLQLTGHKNAVSSVAFSPDGKYIVSGSENGSVHMWDFFTGTELFQLTGHELEVTSVAFSPDGKYIVSGSRDWSVLIWNPSTGACWTFGHITQILATRHTGPQHLHCATN
ncbi:hypothetical protein C0992_011298 [Termitomyces sp. T32_za158]|nr:hypothetical protein C0992_011298 [Termitomyces sp. T32_za158]